MVLPSSAARTEEPIRSDKRGFLKALALFHEVAARVPAYKDFLKRHGVKADRVRTQADFLALPLTDKPGYITQYSIEELSWDGNLETAKYISTSSGSTGVPFFWPRGRRQDIVVGTMMRNVFEKIYSSKKGSTLFVDSFALGTWIAGLEFYNAAKWTADRGSNIVNVTPGIDRAEAINLIKKLSPSFDRVVLGGYPPFVKDILEHGAAAGIDWSKVDMYILVAGEAVSELWKRRILEKIGKPGDVHALVNVYGMADSGVVANDSPLCSLLRMAREADPSILPNIPQFSEVTGLYQFNPMYRYFEVIGRDSLVLTSDAGLPLIRYDTRDTGGIIPFKTAERYLSAASKTDMEAWHQPFIYLHGRKDLSISLYALNIYVENIKSALETSSSAKLLSGLFIMSVDHDEALDQVFTITIELAAGVDPSGVLSEKIKPEIVAKLREQNAEYAKLHSTLGAKAEPRVVLIPYGKLETIPGRKHKWIKR